MSSASEPLQRRPAGDVWFLAMISGSVRQSAAARARLENYDMAAQLAGLDAVTGNTTEKQACYWGYWLQYLQTIKLANDPFLSGFSHCQKHRIISGFGAAVRANDVQTYPGASSATAPISSMVHATFNDVAQPYQSHDRKAPSTMQTGRSRSFYNDN